MHVYVLWFIGAVNTDEVLTLPQCKCETTVDVEDASTFPSSVQMTGMDINVLYISCYLFSGWSADDLVLLQRVPNSTQLREVNSTGEN